MSEFPQESPRDAVVADGWIRSIGESDLDRGLIAVSHLWPLLGLLTGTLPLAFLLPIVVWLARKDRSPLVDDQGRELINVVLTFAILLLVPIFGWLALLVWGPVWIVSSIRAAIVSRDGRYFRYPMTLRFVP